MRGERLLNEAVFAVDASDHRSRGWLDGTSALEHRSDLAAELWDATLGDVPDKFVVDTEVVVNQAVTHASHGTPIEGWILRAEVPRNLLDRFSDDFKAPNKARRSVSLAMNSSRVRPAV
jgi:hypothetical protein